MTVGILGCGWLGIPLAQRLLADGFSVKGTTTSTAKIDRLTQLGIAAFQIELETDAVVGDLDAFIESIDVLMVDIPPRFHFSQKIERLCAALQSAPIKRVLLISSTSIYDHEKGKLTDANLPNPKTEKGNQLFKAEQSISNGAWTTTVFRLGGLVGPNRHPVKYLAGQTDLENPDAPVNLLHLDDAVGMIVAWLADETIAGTFNIVAPEHPTRKNYYTAKAIEYQLAAPSFVASGGEHAKVIDGQLPEKLGYIFKKPAP